MHGHCESIRRKMGRRPPSPRPLRRLRFRRPPRLGGRGGMDPDDMRAGRMLAQGDLRLIALALIAEAPRHGYEIIKLVEEKTADWYSPSPGIVYPTLTYLEEAGYVTASTEGSKKLYAITDEGRAYLDGQSRSRRRGARPARRARRTREPLAARRTRRARQSPHPAAARRGRLRSFARNRRQAARRRRRGGSASGRNPRPRRDRHCSDGTADVTPARTRAAIVPRQVGPACARARAGYRRRADGPARGAGAGTSRAA